MPVVDMQFKDDVFFARQIGHVDRQDAREWAEQLAYYATNNPRPIAVLMDSTEVESVSNGARHIFVKASYIPNIRVAAVAANHISFMQTARVVEMMSSEAFAHVFPSLEEAMQFIKENTGAAQAGK